MMYIIFILNFNIVFMNLCHYFIITWTDSIMVGCTCLRVMIYVVYMMLGSKTTLLTVMIFFKCQCYSEDRETLPNHLNTTSRN